MKDAYELLHQKESDLARVRKEVESLNIVAPLLADDQPSDDPGENSEPTPLSDTISRLSDSAATNADNVFDTPTKSRHGFLNALKRAR